MLGWLRRRSAPPDLPDALWQRTLRAYPFLAAREATEIARLRALAAQFLRDKEFHGADGLAITDEIALAIAAQAVLPVLHLGLRWYDDFVGIVVHRDEVVARRTLTDEAGVVHAYDEVLAGESMEGGPVMLNWRDVSEAGASAEVGYNVVIHEFAHKIDTRDGAADGCPPMPTREARAQWLAVIEPEYARFREQVIVAERFGGAQPWLDDYGATDMGEFFAVACEAYFVNRARFAQEFPALVPLFDGFFIKR
ncbi:zinc-dependent peptidase [Ramlibacter sp. XY19]|uniref:M90 family metallopeptidase n=1 Tax=Ramlibacter paludis TaxID=2908000 RepID=UPI0023DB94B8|nr:M90 family metallopeptidase [Ramlibacter paludis]MCG2592848.1 zinc-dependent peptidase [Ramlibacter paludis]